MQPEESLEQRLEELEEVDSSAPEEKNTNSLFDNYQQFLHRAGMDGTYCFKSAEKQTSKISYTISDISIFINNFRDNMDLYESGIENTLGPYLSALLNNLPTQKKKTELTISTKNFPNKINCLGMNLNGAVLTVDGSVGDNLGHKMNDGTIIIKGYAGDNVGSKMMGGKIIIEKDAGEYVGTEMEGGKIIIKRDAGDNLGALMDGGKIIVNGNAGFGVGACMKYGTIVVKGKLNGSEHAGKYSRGGKIIVYKGDPRGENVYKKHWFSPFAMKSNH